MLFISKVVRKLNPPAAASNWKILSAASKNFSSSTGYSPEELEKFRKVFRTMPSYQESISAKDSILLLKVIGIVKPQETYSKYVEFTDKILGGRFEITQLMKYFRTLHDPRLLMNEYISTFDRNNDGYITKEEFEYGMETLKVHDPRVRNISCKNFLKDADTNKEGKVSVDELRNWVNINLVPA